MTSRFKINVLSSFLASFFTTLTMGVITVGYNLLQGFVLLDEHDYITLGTFFVIWFIAELLPDMKTMEGVDAESSNNRSQTR